MDHEPLEECDAVHSRHFDIEDDDVWAVGDNQLAGFKGVFSSADDLDVLGRLEDADQDRPHQGGVVHDQNLDMAVASHDIV